MHVPSRLGPILISLGLATLLWLVVNNLDRSPATYTVQVTYEHPADVVKVDGFVTAVELRVLGTKPKLRTLSSADFTVRINNSEGRVGREVVVLDSENVVAPFGVVVEQVSPSQVTVVYDRRLVRETPVVADLQGQPTEGYEVDWSQLTVTPAKVRLAGPSRLFAADIVVRTERIDITGRRTTFTSPSVGLVPPSLSFAIEGAANAQVIVPVQPVTARVTFDEVPITVLHGSWRTSAPNPRTVKVTIEGPQPTLRTLTAKDVSVRIDADGLTPRGEDYRLDAEAVLREGACPACKIVALSQRRVNLQVKTARRSQPQEP